MGIWVSLVCLIPVSLQFLLGSLKVLRAEPGRVADGLLYIATTLAILATNGVLDWFPTTFITSPGMAAGLFVGLAALPVAAGLIESRVKGDAYYDPKMSHWLLEHLKNNLLGALAGVGIVYFLNSIQSEVTLFTESTKWLGFMEAILALCTAVAIWFAALQQRVERSEMADGRELQRSTLKNVHQVLNVVWLAYIMSISLRGGVYIIGSLMERRAIGASPSFDMAVLPLLVAILAFFFGCATSPEKVEIYITFLTGTPIAILVQFVWLSLYSGGAEYRIIRWAYPAGALLLYALVVGVTYGRVKVGKVSLFSLVPTLLCITAFWITIIVT